MKIAIKIGKWLVGIVFLIYLLACGYLYFRQETILFHPSKQSIEYQYDFETNFKEKSILTSDGTNLSGVLFQAENPIGLVFYLHGNKGSITGWESVAKTYTNINYDCFILDYRGFGKSEGEIFSQNQFYTDVEIAYDSLKKDYDEKNIIILGYSVGTGSAAMLASKNNPKHLILLAPYYSISDMMSHAYPIIPSFLLKYKFETFSFIPKVKAPITIFHGKDDEVIYYESSVKLKEYFSPKDELITLFDQKHGGINENSSYQKWLNNTFISHQW